MRNDADSDEDMLWAQAFHADPLFGQARTPPGVRARSTPTAGDSSSSDSDDAAEKTRQDESGWLSLDQTPENDESEYEPQVLHDYGDEELQEDPLAYEYIPYGDMRPIFPGKRAPPNPAAPTRGQRRRGTLLARPAKKVIKAQLEREQTFARLLQSKPPLDDPDAELHRAEVAATEAGVPSTRAKEYSKQLERRDVNPTVFKALGNRHAIIRPGAGMHYRSRKDLSHAVAAQITRENRQFHQRNAPPLDLDWAKAAQTAMPGTVISTKFMPADAGGTLTDSTFPLIRKYAEALVKNEAPKVAVIIEFSKQGPHDFPRAPFDLWATHQSPGTASAFGKAVVGYQRRDLLQARVERGLRSLIAFTSNAARGATRRGETFLLLPRDLVKGTRVAATLGPEGGELFEAAQVVKDISE